MVEEKGGRAEKGRGVYRDKAPLIKIQNTPLARIRALSDDATVNADDDVSDY